MPEEFGGVSAGDVQAALGKRYITAQNYAQREPPSTKVISIQLTGTEEVLQTLIRYADAYTNETRKALITEAELIMAQSQRWCPIDTGRLRAGGYLQAQNSGDIVVELGYHDVEYAIYVHEDLTKFHHYPTKAKFFEDALNKAAPDLAERICERVKAVVH